VKSASVQRIVKSRRDYNTWVANETLEDYALRYTPHSFRKWSEFRIANTALGAVSFLALEAIGAAITLSYGFTNALWAILCVAVIIFLTGLPISYYSAKYGVDMDLLTRGAGFGYIGSTITSLIYASFTFIFFALEASIMAQAVQMAFGIPLAWGYVLCSLVIVPLVIHGVTVISRVQAWTQPVWLILMALPFVAILWQEPGLPLRLMHYTAGAPEGAEFDFLLFGSAATVAFSLIAQIGEQVDYLRFLPDQTQGNRHSWWMALLLAGPGWIFMGALKMLGGALLAFLVIDQGIEVSRALEPTQMYLVGFGYVFSDPRWIAAAVALFVIISQVKINITNAYAGSLAWSNFFARLTHSHPGRVVWVIFNVVIAILLMEIGVFAALKEVLTLYSMVAISWVGAVLADLLINKPLKLSPPHIEFRRAYLYDINPVGVGAMLLATVLSMWALSGGLGPLVSAIAPFIALLSALLIAPIIAFATRSRYYLARLPERWPDNGIQQCVICDNHFETADVAHCPAYDGTICSLCCSLDARCRDRCKPHATFPAQLNVLGGALLPAWLMRHLKTDVGKYLLMLILFSVVLGAVLGVIYFLELRAVMHSAVHSGSDLFDLFAKLFAALFLLTGIGTWWLVLNASSRRNALQESERQTKLLLDEIDAHRKTDAELQRAKDRAEASNLAKSRFVTGMSHELRTPLNSILGYAQILQGDPSIPAHRQNAVSVIRRGGEHLLSLIDGMLDIARIEAGKMRLESSQLPLREFLDQIVQMVAPQAAQKGLGFQFIESGRIPAAVHADEKRLRQILINLLANAVKFTDRGAVTLRVTYAREVATFDVEDTGIGIAPEDVNRVFLPFERSDSANQRKEVGTGLGLAISNMLAHIMGGELSVTSILGKGSVFRLRLYLREVRQPAPREDNVLLATGYSGARKRLLVVDDQISQRVIIDEMLSPLGFDIVEADSGEACLAAVAEHRPDLLLMDISMPGMDGWEVCRRLREDGHHELPIIIISANVFDPTARQNDRMYCNDFIAKPFMLDDLLSKLKAHLGIEWLPATPLMPSATNTVRLIPPRSVLRKLVELGDIGFVKGIVNELDTLEKRNSLYAPFCNELRSLVECFRLPDYGNRLKEWMYDDMDHV
jgi:signal transduction histidine kinase/CheY-like chemotaxis protein/purine-cytosine permease-like protein